MNTSSLTEASNIQILYARMDQLTPEATTRSFIESKGTLHTQQYNESHGSILLNSQMYRDYADFLARFDR